MIQVTSNRFELKYIIALIQRDKFINEITPFMKLDKYIKNNHSYEVRSLYFDSPFGKSYYNKKSGLNFRIKSRITFDTNIKVKNYNFILYYGGGSYYIKSPNISIMEIKFNKYIPEWAINIAQRR